MTKPENGSSSIDLNIAVNSGLYELVDIDHYPELSQLPREQFLILQYSAVQRRIDLTSGIMTDQAKKLEDRAYLQWARKLSRLFSLRDALGSEYIKEVLH